MLKSIRLIHNIKTKIPPPKRPKSWECCGSDCTNCVWITYSKKHDVYIQNLQKEYDSIQKEKIDTKLRRDWGSPTINMD